MQHGSLQLLQCVRAEPAATVFASECQRAVEITEGGHGVTLNIV
jgi:hypothetical protein